jgi:hypothetical protein
MPSLFPLQDLRILEVAQLPQATSLIYHLAVSPFVYIEGRIELAIQAFKKGQFRSLQAAALTYDAPITTVRRRARGIRSRRDSQSSNRKLSSTEEETLIQWILSMDQRGMLPTTTSVRRLADLLAQRSESAAPQTVGQNWVRDFVNRHDEIKSKYNHKYDYQRAKCEDPVIIQEWFRRVQSTIEQYGIVTEDKV